MQYGKITVPMSLSGRSLPKFDVCVTSAFRPIATKSRTFRHFVSGQQETYAPQQTVAI